MIVRVLWQEIVIIPGDSVSGWRVARRRTSSFNPTPIIDSGVDTPGMAPWSKAFPDHLPPNILGDGRTYVFGFAVVAGYDLDTSERESFTAGRIANSSHTGGHWQLTVKAYYVWNFGNDGGDNALLLDAYDLDAQDFIADDFIDVTPDPDNTLTFNANNGYIDTDTMIMEGQPITVTARRILREGQSIRLQFSHWSNADPLLAGAIVGPADAPDHIVVHRSDIVVAWGMYSELVEPFHYSRYPLYNPLWWLETHGGLTPPGPSGPWTREFVAAISLANAAEVVDVSLRGKVLETVAEQLNILLKRIMGQIKIASGGQ